MDFATGTTGGPSTAGAPAPGSAAAGAAAAADSAAFARAAAALLRWRSSLARCPGYFSSGGFSFATAAAPSATGAGAR